MAVEYKCANVGVDFLHVVPTDFDAFPYYDEVNRVYFACQQFYKGSTADVGSLTKEQEESILADYKKFCEESLFVGDQYSGVPTLLRISMTSLSLRLTRATEFSSASI